MPEERKMLKEDLECEEHYSLTNKRDEVGTYKSNVVDKPLGSSMNRT